MTIETTLPAQRKKVTITPPCFFKIGTGRYVGVLNEETVYEVIVDGFEAKVRNMNLPKWEWLTPSVLEDAAKDGELVDEQEFFTAYNNARSLTELNPVMFETLVVNP